MTSQRIHLDWMYVRLNKLAEDVGTAVYQFAADIYARDEQYDRRNKRVGEGLGTLMIDKATGEVSLVEPMPEDDREKVFLRAATAIRKHWRSGIYPDATSYQCG